MTHVRWSAGLSQETEAAGGKAFAGVLPPALETSDQIVFFHRLALHTTSRRIPASASTNEGRFGPGGVNRVFLSSCSAPRVAGLR